MSTDNDPFIADEVMRGIEEKRLERMEQFLAKRYDSEALERREIKNWAWNHLLISDFRSLERMAEVYRVERQRTRSGIWKSTLFYSAFKNTQRIAVDDHYRWRQLMSATAGWRKAFPKSPAPAIVAAILLKQRAWAFLQRGLTPDSATLARKNLAAAREVLIENEAVASREPHYFNELSEIALLEKAESVEFLKIIHRGLRLEPEYYQLYFSAVDYFSPKWHGSAEELEAFANMAVDQTYEFEGEGIYARIYWYAAQSVFGIALFRRSNIDWARMSRGMDDVLNRFPDAWNFNHFALFACLAGDAGKTRELMANIDSPLRQVWNKYPGAFKRCKNWSDAYVPPRDSRQEF